MPLSRRPPGFHTARPAQPSVPVRPAVPALAASSHALTRPSLGPTTSTHLPPCPSLKYALSPARGVVLSNLQDPFCRSRFLCPSAPPHSHQQCQLSSSISSITSHYYPAGSAAGWDPPQASPQLPCVSRVESPTGQCLILPARDRVRLPFSQTEAHPSGRGEGSAVPRSCVDRVPENQLGVGWGRVRAGVRGRDR